MKSKEDAMEQQEILGRIIRDKVTNIEGICVGTVDWMFGCRSYLAKLRSEKREDDKEYLGKSIDIPEACVEIVDTVPAIDAVFPAEEAPKFFGKICRDKVTGYEGMCIGREWVFYAEKQYCLQGRYNKKKMRKPYPIWIDEGRIEVIESEDAVAPEEVQSEYKGGVADVPLPML